MILFLHTYSMYVKIKSKNLEQTSDEIDVIQVLLSSVDYEENDE